MSTPSAGWYPDPMGDASRVRYWDGNKWTSDTAPAQNFKSIKQSNSSHSQSQASSHQPMHMAQPATYSQGQQAAQQLVQQQSASSYAQAQQVQMQPQASYQASQAQAQQAAFQAPQPQPQPAEMPNAFCMYCGNKLDPDDLFCTACGSRVG